MQNDGTTVFSFGEQADELNTRQPDLFEVGA